MKANESLIFKKRVIKASLLLLLLLMLFRPTVVLDGAKSGLLLWFDTVLPTLLPFIIISSLIIRLNITRPISKLLYPLLKHLLPISRNGSYPVFIGFLSGIPVGAKTVSELTEKNYISNQEGQYLLALCNNASPMFILGYIAKTQLELPSKGIVLIIICYLSAIISSYLSLPLIKLNKKRNITISTYSLESVPSMNTSAKQFFRFTIVDEAILGGFEVVTKVGGYIILFSVLAGLLSSMHIVSGTTQALLTGILEITTGIHNLSIASISIPQKIVLISTITSFGGLSGLAQTGSVLGNSGLSINTYFITKLISALCAFALSSLYVCFLL